ncbi:MAG: dephospho-CoA kinase [Candidatus Omnitrophica bacterium]|nr:dephospho-CoA kinase [Candidatus Omnitrophota bacterium]
MMLVIGLTGSFGTGKTFVASIFKSLGAEVIDADRIAHKLIKKGTAAHKRIIRNFGKNLLDKNGDIDRRALSEIVFDDKDKLNKLNEIIHPEVIKEIKERVKKSRHDKIVIIDAPLLIEADLGRFVDKVIVVKSSTTKQIERSVKKFGLKKEEVLKRIKNQIPLERKIKMADFVIDNDRARSETKRQVIKIWREFLWR